MIGLIMTVQVGGHVINLIMTAMSKELTDLSD